MWRLLLVPAAVGMLASSPAAHANFVVEGEDVVDTSTGLAWLMPTKTVGLSYSQVLADAGGWISAGWTYATGDQWKTLMTSYVGAANLSAAYHLAPNGGYYAASGDYTATALSAVQEFGATYSFNLENSTYVIHENPGLLQIGSQGYLAGTTNGIPGFGEVTAVLAEPNPGQNGMTEDSPYGRWFESDNFAAYPGSAIGSFLVRAAGAEELAAASGTTAVPEPTSMAIIGVGLTGLLAVQGRRRRK